MTDPDFLSLPPEHTILTPRLRLRTARLSDAEACKSFICDYETMKYSTTGAVAKNDLGAVENWMKARVLGSEVFQFVVTLRGGHDDDGDEGRKEEARGKTKEEVVIGMLGSHHAPEVGYLLDPGEFFLTSFFGCPWYHRVWERERDLYRIECKRSKPRNGFSLSHHSTYPTYLPPKSITTNSKCKKKKVTILTPPPPFPSPRRQRLRNRSPPRLHPSLLRPHVFFLLLSIIKPSSKTSNPIFFFFLPQLHPRRNRPRQPREPKRPAEMRLRVRRAVGGGV